jgi:hypothetical protein
MNTMSDFQQITYHGEVVAVVIADQAIIPKALPVEDRKAVEAMCLYALEVAAGQHAGSYSDDAALAYAQRAAAAAAERAG